MTKRYPIYHLIKSGMGWTARSWCGRSFPRVNIAKARGQELEFLDYPEDWTCDRCRDAYLGLKRTQK